MTNNHELHLRLKEIDTLVHQAQDIVAEPDYQPVSEDVYAASPEPDNNGRWWPSTSYIATVERDNDTVTLYSSYFTTSKLTLTHIQARELASILNAAAHEK